MLIAYLVPKFIIIYQNCSSFIFACTLSFFVIGYLTLVCLLRSIIKLHPWRSSHYLSRRFKNYRFAHPEQSSHNRNRILKPMRWSQYPDKWIHYQIITIPTLTWTKNNITKWANSNIINLPLVIILFLLINTTTQNPSTWNNLYPCLQPSLNNFCILTSPLFRLMIILSFPSRGYWIMSKMYSKCGFISVFGILRNYIKLKLSFLIEFSIPILRNSYGKRLIRIQMKLFNKDKL